VKAAFFFSFFLWHKLSYKKSIAEQGEQSQANQNRVNTQHLNPVSLPPGLTLPRLLVTPSNFEVIASTNSKVGTPKLIKLDQ
jgi:hypothetical protein